MLRGNRAICSEALAHALHCVVELAAVCRGVGGQCGLVKLRPARQHGSDDEMPTLAPMLRDKLISPEAALFFFSR